MRGSSGKSTGSRPAISSGVHPSRNLENTVVNQRVIAHPIRLVGELFAFIGMMRGLLGKIDLLPRHPGVELVARIWSQVGMDSLGRPGPAPDFT